MKKKHLFITTILVILLVSGVALFLYVDDINDNGRSYTNKTSLCKDFARSYLQTISKTENDFNEKKQGMAIDVETELYTVCLLELNPDALREYMPKALEKYNK